MVVIIAACSEAKPKTIGSPPASAPESGGAEVWIELALDPAAAGGYAEGAIPFVAISEAVETRSVEHGDLLHVPAGTYTLRSHVQPCSGSCESLDPATDACEADVVESGDEITVTLLLSPGHPCRVGTRSGPPADVVGVLGLSRYDGASMPYDVGGRCVLIDSFYVPVFPEGWSLHSDGDEPLELRDPTHRLVAGEGELIWLDGELSEETMPFGCDLGVRFDVKAVIEVEQFAPNR